MNVQAYAGQYGAQGFQPGDKTILGLIAGAVMQVSRGRPFRFGLERLEPGEEGRYADTPGDPYLPGSGIASGDVKATVWTLHTYRLPRLQTFRKVFGVVAQRFDLEADGAIAMVGASDGEWMCTFLVVKGHEGKLPGLVPTPTANEMTSHRGDLIRWMFDGDYVARRHA